MSDNVTNQSNTITSSAAILGAVLLNLRAAKGLKQTELAEAVGTGPTTWSRIEKGETGITFDQIKAAAKALDVTPGKIFELVEVAEEAAKSQGIRVEEGGSKQLDNVLSGAAIGAMAGVFIPIVGPLLGSLLGSVIASNLGTSKANSTKK